MSKSQSVKYNPFVSIICVTFNRRPFFETFFQCIRNQDYPSSRYEVIIVDDGTDKIRDLVRSAKIPQIKYFELSEKMTLGRKRNYSHTLIDKKSKYITYFDDDDYHFPCRISHAISMLEKNKSALCAGTSEIYVYFDQLNKIYKFGPYAQSHATAGTFTFRTELLSRTKFNDNACLSEEKEFLINYTIPFLQLDPLQTILVISHDHNTSDKRKILGSGSESEKSIDLFMHRKNETKIKKFFVFEIRDLLKEYELGRVIHKPDVLKQIKDVELSRSGAS